MSAAASQRRIFNSVFPSSSSKHQPTPQATPVIGGGSFGSGGTGTATGTNAATAAATTSTSFSSSDSSADASTLAQPPPPPRDLAAAKVQRERAWHAATAFLQLPEYALTLADARLSPRRLERKWGRPAGREVAAAVGGLVREEREGGGGGGEAVAGRERVEGLLEWYGGEITRHLVGFQRGVLVKILAQDASINAFEQLMVVLEVMEKIYFASLEGILRKVDGRDGPNPQVERLRDLYHSTIFVSLPQDRLELHFSNALRQRCAIVLGIRKPEEGEPGWNDSQEYDRIVYDAAESAFAIMERASELGLGGSFGERLLAEVMNELMDYHVNEEYAGQVTEQTKTMTTLSAWVVELWAALAQKALPPPKHPKMTTDDIDQWKSQAQFKLSSLRLREAFDIVVDWQNCSETGLSDLAEFTKSFHGRAQITNQFSMAVMQRLLQPGASTIEILQVYIHIVMAFLDLDPKGVLLDRILRPIRRYLRERDDTVRIIIHGLLAEPDQDLEVADPMNDLARVMNDVKDRYEAEDEADVELYTLDWTPDPVDAAPEYKGDESSEVIGSLIDIFDNKDIFVREIQNTLSERLLNEDTDFYREVSVLELFKKRLGENALQSCEVMLRDISDSRRIDEHVLKEIGQPEDTPAFSSKILSRLYWPSLHEETFKLPPEIARLREAYASGYEQFKTQRKLLWLDAIGRARVELELQDRTVEEEVHTWQASVIYAFQEEEGEGGAAADGKPVSKTAAQLEEELEMDDDLVAAALNFWVGKFVLRRDPDTGAYSVLETLPTDSGGGGAAGSSAGNAAGSAAIAREQAALEVAAAAASASAAATESATSAVRSEEEIMEEKMSVYWQFIVSMLTNQGAMPLQRIVMMLSFTVQGGFPYGNEEVRAFLAKKVDEGKLELAGGNYKVIKDV